MAGNGNSSISGSNDKPDTICSNSNDIRRWIQNNQKMNWGAARYILMMFVMLGVGFSWGHSTGSQNVINKTAAFTIKTLNNDNEILQEERNKLPINSSDAWKYLGVRQNRKLHQPTPKPGN